jgi:CRISPR-associated endonuclease/helicase Cas3
VLDVRGTYYSHTPPFKGGPWHTLRDHLNGVTSIATYNASFLGIESEATLAARLHDLGKYGELFQGRLHGEGSGIDHWTIGAWIALKTFQSVDVALAIQGHHIGLQQGNKDGLIQLKPGFKPSIRLSEADESVLLDRLGVDGIFLLPVNVPVQLPDTASRMLKTRMLFSTLVDADFLDTASHFSRKHDEPKQPPTFSRALGSC